MKRLEAAVNESLTRWYATDLQIAVRAKQSGWSVMRHGPYYAGGPELVQVTHPAYQPGKYPSHQWSIRAEIYDAVTANSKIGPHNEIIQA